MIARVLLCVPWRGRIIAHGCLGWKFPARRRLDDRCRRGPRRGFAFVGAGKDVASVGDGKEEEEVEEEECEEGEEELHDESRCLVAP